MRKPKREQRGENSEIGRQVRRETPVLAGVTETTAGDIESAYFCRGGREGEDHDQRGQDAQRATIEKPDHERNAAENFKPGQIERESDTNGPRQDLEIFDIVSELNRVEHFERAGINKNAGHTEIDNPPKDV